MSKLSRLGCAVIIYFLFRMLSNHLYGLYALCSCPSILKPSEALNPGGGGSDLHAVGMALPWVMPLNVGMTTMAL